MNQKTQFSNLACFKFQNCYEILLLNVERRTVFGRGDNNEGKGFQLEEEEEERTIAKVFGEIGN